MLFVSILLVFNVFAYVDAELPSDCETPLNTSECGLHPSMVYTHLSRLSLCYPAIWRGCATENKFANRYQCLTRCVNTEDKNKRCNSALNTSRCNDEIKEVYTFSIAKNTCIKALWYGCPTNNAYANMTSCMENCPPNWFDELARMDISEAQEASDVVNELIQNYDKMTNKRTASPDIKPEPIRSEKKDVIYKIKNSNLDETPEIADINIMLLDDLI